MAERSGWQIQSFFEFSKASAGERGKGSEGAAHRSEGNVGKGLGVEKSHLGAEE